MPVDWAAAKRCESLWLQGVSSLRRGDLDAAAQAFQAATVQDPTAADAWLGLHATGHGGDRSVEAMARQVASFGELRTRLHTPLESRFMIGEYADFRLESPHDLWLAGMASMLAGGQVEQAWAALAQARLDREETRFLVGRCALLRKDWSTVLVVAEPIRDRFLREESQLWVAVALINRKVFGEALEVLRPLPVLLGAHRKFLGELAFLRGLARDGLGDSSGALALFEKAYRYFPEHSIIAARVNIEVPSENTELAQPEPEVVRPEPDAVARTPFPSVSTRRAPGAQRDFDDAMEQLDNLIGLQPVKDQVRMLSAQLRMAALRRSRGLSTAPMLQHFVFTGPPGTGKTTVARIVGKLLHGLGLLAEGHVVEAQRVDLVGRHLGETAIKTTQVIDSALDGVLFIDEAYSLQNSGYVDGKDAYGQEALQVLLKRAEDDRDRLVVVLAGYPDEIAELLSSNPGLASRFSTRVEFPSYSAADLVAITHTFLAAQMDTLDSPAESALRACCQDAVGQDLIDSLGNGRFARELSRKAAAVRDLRLADKYGDTGEPTAAEMVTVGADDVTSAYLELLRAVSSTP